MKYEIVKYILDNSILKKIFKKYMKSQCFTGQNTFVLIKKNGKKVYNPKIKGLDLFFCGINNYFELREPLNIKERMEVRFLGDGARVTIDKCLGCVNLKMFLDKNTTVEIGKNFGSHNSLITTNGAYGHSIKIGDFCMFSYDVIIRNSDVHTIFDINTKEALNPPKDTKIQNHVWLCAGSMILKGASIPSNCIVGARSLVNKEFIETNCIIAGSPARVIKRGVNWNYRKNYDYKELNSH